MPGAAFMHHNIGAGEHRSDVADPAGVVQVNVRDHNGGEVTRAYAEAGERIPDDRGRRRCAGLHQARTL